MGRFLNVFMCPCIALMTMLFVVSFTAIGIVLSLPLSREERGEGIRSVFKTDKNAILECGKAVNELLSPT